MCVRERVIDVLAYVAPSIHDSLQAGVDIAHHLRPKDTGKNRAIIIFFAVPSIWNAVWLAARKCKFLPQINLRITEPLSPEDRVIRNKLWPLIKKAREEGKRASFRSAFALIDGGKNYFSDVK